MNGLLWGIFSVTVISAISAVVVEMVQLYKQKMDEYNRSSKSEKHNVGRSSSGPSHGIRHVGK